MRARLARMSVLAALSLAGLLTAPSAQAQTCAMLPHGTPPGSPAAPGAAREEAHQAVARALRADRVTVIATADAQRRMVGEDFAECAQLECGSSVAESLGVDFAVLVTVWAPRGRPTSVSVALIGADDSAGGDTAVGDAGVAAAALQALTTARQRWQAAQMGFVEVSSTPAGAHVEIDGRPVGVTPLRHLVARGQRTVRLTLEGYTAAEQTVLIEPTESQPVDVTLSEAGALEPDPPAAQTEIRSESHWANWLIGGALVAGGIAAAISPLHTLARLGECTDRPAVGVCRADIHFGAQSGALTGLALASLAVGVVFFAAQPLTVTTTIETGAASVRVHGTF